MKCGTEISLPSASTFDELKAICRQKPDCARRDPPDGYHFPLPDDTVDNPEKLLDTGLSGDHPMLRAAADLFPIRITAYLRSLIGSPDDPIGCQVIRTGEELKAIKGSPDPQSVTQQLF